MDVSIIIVNYNTLKLTQECIDSVFEKTHGLDFEVILVDNGSTDGSKEYFERDGRIRYIYSENNLGFGRANNLGCKVASGEYYFFLNSDTKLVNNAICLLWNQMEEFRKQDCDKVACAGCILLDSNNLVVHSYAKFPSMIRTILNDSIGAVLWKLHIIKSLPSTSNYSYENFRNMSYFDVDYITGADLMVKSDVAQQYGLFDEDFFMYSEETEMQHRYMRAGYRRIIISGPEIIHLEGKSNSSHTPRRTTMVLRSSFLYFKKTSTRFSFLLFSFFFKLIYVSTLLLSFPFVNGKNRDKWSHIKDVVKM